jgi:hypothetical protein
MEKEGNDPRTPAEYDPRSMISIFSQSIVRTLLKNNFLRSCQSGSSGGTTASMYEALSLNPTTAKRKKKVISHLQNLLRLLFWTLSI